MGVLAPGSRQERESDQGALSARRRAAQVLYQLFREASGEQRLAYGNEYLAVVLPLLGAAADLLDHTDRAAVREYVARSRRVLEVALAEGVGRATAAGTVLADLETLAVRDGVDLTEFEDEIDCRRVQQLLLIDQPAAAEPYGRLFHALLERGVWLAPSAYEVGFVSLAHTEKDFERFSGALGEALVVAAERSGDGGTGP